MNIIEIKKLINKCPDSLKDKVMLKYDINSYPVIEVGDNVKIIGDSGVGSIHYLVGTVHEVIKVKTRMWGNKTSDDDIVIKVKESGWYLSYEMGHFEKV